MGSGSDLELEFSFWHCLNYTLSTILAGSQSLTMLDKGFKIDSLYTYEFLKSHSLIIFLEPRIGSVFRIQVNILELTMLPSAV